MGQTPSRLSDMVIGKKTASIAMVGLTIAGKTSILHFFKTGQVLPNASVTSGSEMDIVDYRKFSLFIWDVGGQTKLSYCRYLLGAGAFIFVVDSGDKERVSEARDALHFFLDLDQDNVMNKPLLVFANKQDLPDAMSASEITDMLNLHSLRVGCWHIQSACAISGEGIHEGFDWLCNNVTGKKSPFLERFQLEGDNQTPLWVEMGATISRFMNTLFGKKETKILMVGLDGAGKTTILYKLKFGEVVTTIPTLGFNVETIEYKKVSFTVWDVGGQDKIRPLWRHYFQNAEGLIFVVDSNDKDRISESKDELHRMLNEDELRGVTLLIFSNKQDLQNAMSVSEITDKLDLRSLRQPRWHIQCTCATSGQGLYEGLEWMSNKIDSKRSSM